MTRGLRTGLVEARDLASGTSSRSSKLLHGGLRYLEMLDFGLVHEALRERGLISATSPRTWPVGCRSCTRCSTGSGSARTPGPGVLLYDLFAATRRGNGQLPRHRHLTRARRARKAPSLRKDALVGAIPTGTGRSTTPGTR